MKHRFQAVRRLAVVGIAATTALTGLSVLALSSPASAAPATGSAITASSSTIIRPTGTNQAAGNLVVTLQPGSTCTTGDTIVITALDSLGNATVDFTSGGAVAVANVTGTVPPTATTPAAGAGTNSLTSTITCGAGATTYAAGETFTFSGLAYNSTAAAGGAVEVTATYGGTALISTAASNAAVTTGVPSNINVYAASASPAVAAGIATAQTAANESIGLAGDATSWETGDSISLTVADGANVNCTTPIATTLNTVAFGAAPAVNANVTAGQTTAIPTFGTPTLSASGPCAGTTVDNTVTLTFTNSGAIIGSNPLGSHQPVTISLTGITYIVGAGAGLGQVWVGSSYTSGGTTTLIAPSNTAWTSPTSSGPSNAFISSVLVNGNTPPVGLVPGAPNAAISPIAIVEGKGAVIPVGYVCVSLGGGSVFDAASTPTVAASGGGTPVAAVGSLVVGMGSSVLSFQVTTASSTAAATYTLSGLAVDAQGFAGPVYASVSTGIVAGCSGGPVLNGGANRVFSVITSNRIAGENLNGTAAESLFAAYPTNAGCVEPLAPSSLLTGNAPRAVILATDNSYEDALSASYLAGRLGTGVLLTDMNTLSPEAANAIRLEGVTEVYVVGGPLAISANVVAQVQALPAYNCGGTVVQSGLTGPSTVSVVGPIFGQTADDTSQAIAEYLGSSSVGTLSAPGAYGSGTTMYNDTAGNGSAAPSTTNAMRTAIVATDGGFQDAVVGSAPAYNRGFPVLLTPTGSLGSQAQNAIVDLGIQQVIVIGGQLAVSNAVVTSLQGMGVSVIRIAGADYTDTSQLLAQFDQNAVNAQGVANGLGWGDPEGNNQVVVARGDFFADAETVSALAGNGYGPNGYGIPDYQAMPILLTMDPNTIGTPVTTFLNNAGGTYAPFPVFTITVSGGPLAIAPATLAGLMAALAQG
ncbi:MAG: beta strand repeat-containing protein [Acidimicrobiales bacterium]